MALLKDSDKKQLEKEFQSLTTPVKLVMFTQTMECQYCKETRMIAEEVAELSDKISLDVYDFQADAEVAEHYGIDKIPAMAILADGDEPKDYGIRFFGIPSGYEFSTLIEDILMVSSGDSGLSQATRDYVANLKEPLHLQVFITPT